MASAGLPFLLAAAAWACSATLASGLHRTREVALATAIDEDKLERPLKVFTIFDRAYTRIAKVWRDCLTEAISGPLDGLSVEATEVPAQRPAPPQRETRFPPSSLSRLLVNEWATKLATSDTLHIDADAFLLKDPVRGTTLKYPEADIIAAVDCVHDRPACSWYRSREYLQRNNYRDPLEAQGFMLNTGFMYLRSSPATIDLLNRAISLTNEGENEQVALNSVLLRLGCAWTLANGSRAPRGPAALDHLQGDTLHGRCNSSISSPEQPQPLLRVVVLPYSNVPRGEDVQYHRGTVMPLSLAYHPGGGLEHKEQLLGHVRHMCMAKRQ
mmetsp:Transcript_69380/g.206659  ORF Transcript_69380/g.206659 Transcript_69380/m.206659 type:complete len:327 (-) Transcript_69380:35-1015(-)